MWSILLAGFAALGIQARWSNPKGNGSLTISHAAADTIGQQEGTTAIPRPGAGPRSDKSEI
jgi:hypothetical protein